MSGRAPTVRPGGLVALRGKVGPVVLRPRAASRSSAGFTEIEFVLDQVRVLCVQTAGGPPLAKEGDELALVGLVKEGGVEPVAWWNFSKSRGYSPRVWEFWPCVAGMGVLLLLLVIRITQGTLGSVDLLRTSVPLLLLAVLASAAHSRRKAVRAVAAMRAGQAPVL